MNRISLGNNNRSTKIALRRERTSFSVKDQILIQVKYVKDLSK